MMHVHKACPTSYQGLAQIVNSLSGIVHKHISEALNSAVCCLCHCLPCHSIKEGQRWCQLMQLSSYLSAQHKATYVMHE